MSFLDDIIKKTQERQVHKRELDEFSELAKKAAATLPPPPPDLKEPLERAPRKWAGDPDTCVAGLAATDRFELVDCGEELDGNWVVSVVRTDREPRQVVAIREEGGPPWITLDEDVVREEMASGRLRLLPRG